MVGDQQGLAQDGLPLAVLNARVQIRQRVFDQLNKRAQVFEETLDALSPIILARLYALVRPVAFGPLRRDVRGRACELKYVPLRDSHVFEQLPRRVRHARGLPVYKFCGEVLHHLFKLYVRAAAAQKVQKVLAQGFVFVVCAQHKFISR